MARIELDMPSAILIAIERQTVGKKLRPILLRFVRLGACEWDPDFDFRMHVRDTYLLEGSEELITLRPGTSLLETNTPVLLLTLTRFQQENELTLSFIRLSVLQIFINGGRMVACLQHRMMLDILQKSDAR